MRPNLTKTGFTVHGADPSPTAQAAVAAIGVDVHAAPGPWLAQCDTVILSLARPEILHAVASDLAGVLRADQIVVETGHLCLGRQDRGAGQIGWRWHHPAGLPGQRAQARRPVMATLS